MSTRTQITLGVVVGLVLPVAIFVLYMLEEIERHIDFQIQNKTKIVSEAISEPLSVGDTVGARFIAGSFLNDDSIYSISAMEEGEKRELFSVSTNKSPYSLNLKTGTFILKQQDGAKLIKVSFLIDKVEKEQLLTHTKLLMLMGLQVMLTLAIIVFILFKKVVIPMNRLLLQSKKMAENSLEEPFIWDGEDEFAKVGKAFDAARESILKHQNRVIEAQKLSSLGEMAEGMSSELIEPVTNLHNAIEQIEMNLSRLSIKQGKGELTKSQFYEIVQELQQSSTIAYSNTDFIKNTLLALKEAGDTSFAKETHEFNLKEYMQLSFSSYIEELKFQGISLELICNDVNVSSSPKLISTITKILVENAILHAFDRMSKSPKIEISISADKQYINYRYKDNGKGISKELLGRIYEPFFGTKKDQKHLGIGLHYLYNLVTKEAGGEINTNSDVGEGFETEIRVPLNTKS